MCPANCPDREQLQAYAAGRISDQTADTVADHIDECTDCQAALETIDDAEDSLVVRLRRAPAREKYQDESQYEEAMARAAAAAGDAFRTGGEPTTDGTVRTSDLKQVGEYQLLEKLGQGGMGTVYKALQTKLQRVVALKLLSKSRLDDEKAVARFDREMVAIGGLDHPNIVRATHAGEHEGTSYLVMDYVDGRYLLAAGAGQPADGKPGLDGDYAIRLWRLQPTTAEQPAAPTTSSLEQKVLDKFIGTFGFSTRRGSTVSQAEPGMKAARRSLSPTGLQGASREKSHSGQNG